VDADVIVVGAGLAGLAAARAVAAAGREVVVLEAGDAVGGRVRTDEVDGCLLDRGFQLLNPAYPEVRRVLDLPALRLRPFAPGVAVRDGDAVHVVTDPRRQPAALPAALRAPGTLPDKVRLAAWLALLGYQPADRLRAAHPDTDAARTLRAHGARGELGAVVDRFLLGVLAAAPAETSSRPRRRAGWSRCCCGRSYAARRRCRPPGCARSRSSWPPRCPPVCSDSARRPPASSPASWTPRPAASPPPP
jgi:phytoene dehydrogenase-like protein